MSATLTDHFAISLCVWTLCYLHAILSIKKFIVNRYENETCLTKTIFFQNHVPFVRSLPSSFSAGFYGVHLLMCIWGWPIFCKKAVFKDIKDPSFVSGFFSAKEVRRVKWMLISGLMFFTHGVAYFFFRFIWPEHFG